MEGRERSEANLKPHQYKKGQSGNPKGRPKGALSLTNLIKKELADDRQRQAKMLAKALIYQAARGNQAAIREIMGRIDGPIKEEVEHSFVQKTVIGIDPDDV